MKYDVIIGIDPDVDTRRDSHLVVCQLVVSFHDASTTTTTVWSFSVAFLRTSAR